MLHHAIYLMLTWRHHYISDTSTENTSVIFTLQENNLCASVSFLYLDSTIVLFYQIKSCNISGQEKLNIR